MIILTDVAAKLQELLNSEDCPTDFQFVVKSQGYHLDSIADKTKGINKIPVFLEMVGGEYNPVPNLKEANFTYGVNIWFPIRFKETFYALNEYLESVFVGKKLTFGTKTALCNISVAEYGEIVGVHLDQFEDWVEGTYEGAVHLFKNEHDISEKYMNMKFNIYATAIGEGFMLGNDVKFELSATFKNYYPSVIRIYNETLHSWHDYERYQEGDDVLNLKYCYRYATNDIRYYVDVMPQQTGSFPKFIKGQFSLYTRVGVDNEYVKCGSEIVIQKITYSEYPVPAILSTPLIFTNSGTGASVSPVAQQLIGETYAKNISNIVNFNKSTLIYPQDNDFWAYFLYAYNTQNLQSISNLQLTKKYGNGMEFSIYQIVLAINENIQLGEPLSFTLTYGDKK